MELFIGTAVGFALGCFAADMALRRKTGFGIRHWLETHPHYMKGQELLKKKEAKS